MFSKVLIVAVTLLSGLALEAHAHAGLVPALGIANGRLARNQVKRPSTANPCGNGINIAQAIDASTPIKLGANNQFSATIQNFNGGRDGSRSIREVKVSGTGAANAFAAARVVTNGNPNPANVGTERVTIQLPANTRCTGGKTRNRCIVSATTTAGFGNCVVVEQGAAARRDLVWGSRAARAARAAEQEYDPEDFIVPEDELDIDEDEADFELDVDEDELD